MSTLSKVSVWVAVAFLAIFMYTVGYAMTYRLHETLYPGRGDNLSDDSHNIAVFWPVGLPITAALYAVGGGEM